MTRWSVLRACALWIMLCFGMPLQALELTTEEQAYLRERGPISYCSDPDWMPFEGLDRRGKHIGIGADFIAEFSRLLNIEMNRVPASTWSEVIQLGRQRSCDFLSLTNPSAERAQYFSFTEPYVKLPVVLIGRKGHRYLDGIQALEGEAVAVIKDSILVDMVQSKNSLVEIKQYPVLLDILRAVLKEEAEAAATILPVALYHIQKTGLSTLEISGHTDLTMSLTLAVRNDDPLLVSILNKAVAAIEPQLHDQIMHRWYSIEIQQARDYTLLLVLVVALCVVVAFLIYRNYIGRRFSSQLAKVNARLTDRNKRLEQVCQHDYLTGVMNRVKMDTELNRALQRAAQQCQPLALILLDLDRFGRVNQQHGHQAGDMVLVEICRLLEQSLPDWARLGRWVGDRFLVICPRTTETEARSLARTITLTLQLHQYSEEVHISASASIALCDGTERAAAVMHALERQLRQAKTDGPQQLVLIQRGDQYSGGSEDPAA